MRDPARLLRAACAAALAAPALAAAQPPRADGGRLTVDMIFRTGELSPDDGPTIQWMGDGRSWVEARAAGAGSELVRVDAATGRATVLVPAAALVDEAGRPIAVEAVELSPDERKALLFHGSVRVWRSNTRGTYHVVDLATRRVTPIATVTTPGGVRPSHAADSMDAPALGQTPPAPGIPTFIGRGLASGAADPRLQMFAKFSPDSRAVAFVRANDLWVTDLATGRETRLTRDGSDDVINGTTDWVYEEELGLRDAFRWSPDSRRLAYWRFDQSAVPAVPMQDDVSGQYQRVSVLRYPKAGAPNSRVRLGVVAAAGGETRWLDVGPDTGQYLARADWVDADSIAVQRLPRRQDRLDLLVVSATSGRGRTLLTDRDSAYVDVEGEAVTWLDGGRSLLLRSDRSGWRQLYLYDRGGRLLAQVTPDGADYLDVAGVDEARGAVYVTAAAPTPTQRTVYRCALRLVAKDAPAARCDAVTTAPGTHEMDVSPDARYAVDTHSRLGEPPTTTLYELPAMRAVRTLEDNRDVRDRLAALGLARPELVKVPMPDGTVLDGYRITPAGFDSTRRYPVLMHVYGGPAAPQVNDAWGGQRYLWHQLLAARGYVVVVVDNRGAAWRGRDFRKVTQYALGVRESQDQIDAARWIGARTWADPARIGIWGWSFGGYMTAMSVARGGSVFKMGIVGAPVIDWRFYDTIYTERFMWTPQANPLGYRSSAVLTYVPTQTARVLIAHGTGDDNVHPQNSLVYANALIAAGKPFYMLLYPNRTHAVSGGGAAPHLYEQMTRFVLENL